MQNHSTQNKIVLDRMRTADQATERLAAMGVTVLAVVVCGRSPTIIVQPHDSLNRIGSGLNYSSSVGGKRVEVRATHFEGCDVKWGADTAALMAS